MDERKERCKNCRFWENITHACGFDVDPDDPQQDDELGWCHRFPPSRINSADEMNNWLFPVAHHNDWCGEWQPAADESRP